MPERIGKKINLLRKLEIVVDLVAFVYVEIILKPLEMKDEIVWQRFDRNRLDCVDVTATSLTAIFVVFISLP